MPKNSENLNRQLFDLLKSKGYSPSTLDTSGKETPVPEEAEVFQFDFTKDGEDYGKVTVSIDGLHKLVVYFGDDVANSAKSDSDDPASEGGSWYSLLRHLKKFAKNRQLSFELKNSNHLKHDMAKREYMKNKEKISEGYYPMGKKASYSDSVPNVKIVIEHTRQIEEGEQRYRNVNRIFLENQDGERFLLDTKQPGIARVYARHIAEGGKVNDERWGHISSLCEEYKKMSGFVRAVRNGQFNESAQQLVNEGINHYQSLRETLSRMTGHRGYNMYFESWTPALMEDEVDTTSLNELFVQETLDPRIESVMPILSKLHKQVSEMSEVGALAEWADSLLEGGDGGEASEETDGDTPGDAGEGGAEDAPADSMSEATDLKSIPEGRLDGSADIDSPVANAITNRILMQRVDLLAKYGPEKVSDAITSVADYVGDFISDNDEIGTSDVSGWVKQVEQELSGMNEGEPGDLEHELERQEYERDRERDEYAEKEANKEMDESLGDIAKKVGGAIKSAAGKAIDKLGHGSDDELLKDLQRKAGIRAGHGKPSMAHSDVEKREEGVAEDLDANQKRVGQLGPTEKVGPKGAVGKLVGANESVELSEMDSQGYKGTRDSDDEGGKAEGKATPIKAKDMAKKGEKALDKEMDDAHKKEVKEGQEDLDAILRIIRK